MAWLVPELTGPVYHGNHQLSLVRALNWKGSLCSAYREGLCVKYDSVPCCTLQLFTPDIPLPATPEAVSCQLKVVFFLLVFLALQRYTWHYLCHSWWSVSFSLGKMLTFWAFNISLMQLLNLEDLPSRDTISGEWFQVLLHLNLCLFDNISMKWTIISEVGPQNRSRMDSCIVITCHKIVSH